MGAGEYVNRHPKCERESSHFGCLFAQSLSNPNPNPVTQFNLTYTWASLGYKCNRYPNSTLVDCKPLLEVVRKVLVITIHEVKSIYSVDKENLVLPFSCLGGLKHRTWAVSLAFRQSLVSDSSPLSIVGNKTSSRSTINYSVSTRIICREGNLVNHFVRESPV